MNKFDIQDLPTSACETDGREASDVERLVMRKCAACGTEKPLAEMSICMHNQMHRYVCDMKCMIKFYA